MPGTAPVRSGGSVSMSLLPHASSKTRMLVSAGCPALSQHKRRPKPESLNLEQGPIFHGHSGCSCFWCNCIPGL